MRRDSSSSGGGGGDNGGGSSGGRGGDGGGGDRGSGGGGGAAEFEWHPTGNGTAAHKSMLPLAHARLLRAELDLALTKVGRCKLTPA